MIFQGKCGKGYSDHMITTPPSTTNFTVGLQNKNSVAERMSATRDAQTRIEENRNAVQNRNSDSKAEVGLQDRNSSDERLTSITQLQSALVENHGYDAKEYVKAALTTNTKIINTPVLQRGSLLDIRI